MESSTVLSLRIMVLSAGVALMLVGAVLWFYANYSVSNLEQALSNPSLTQEDRWRYEGSLQWWRNAFYYPLAALLITVGLTAFLFALVLRQR